MVHSSIPFPAGTGAIELCASQQSVWWVVTLFLFILQLWDAGSGSLLQKLPADLPVLDVCPYEVNRSSFLALLTEKMVKIYKWQWLCNSLPKWAALMHHPFHASIAFSWPLFDLKVGVRAYQCCYASRGSYLWGIFPTSIHVLSSFSEKTVAFPSSKTMCSLSLWFCCPPLQPWAGNEALISGKRFGRIYCWRWMKMLWFPCDLEV